MVELTCPCEENFEVRHKEKEARYEGLAADCRKAGWRTYVFAVEVGARGYAADSLLTCLRRLGVKSRVVKKITTSVSNCALRSSFWIWLKRAEAAWCVRTNNEMTGTQVGDNGNTSRQKEVEANAAQEVTEQVRLLRKEADDRSTSHLGRNITDTKLKLRKPEKKENEVLSES